MEAAETPVINGEVVESSVVEQEPKIDQAAEELRTVQEPPADDMEPSSEAVTGDTAVEQHEKHEKTVATVQIAKSEKAPLQALNVSDFRSQQHVADLGRDCTALHHVFGADTSRKGNMSLIELDTIIYATSTAVVFQNVSTAAKEYLMGVSDGGIGCVAVHPTRKLFAVGAKGFQPNIYIYSYPAKKLLRVLSGGAERGYSCMNFSPDGEKLATVSSSPDFMLTIWEWEEQKMGLHSKAFGQDIYNVFFSQDDPGRLTTSGVGHIRFWKMAATFTGLKLQGSIGKFGKIDLSDIDTFVELPDGKVVSSTETGSLLVWEGHFIKCRLTRTGGRPCHSGPVTFLSLDRVEKRIISASTDGYIRWWSFAKIDNAEVDSDHSMDFELEPVAELYLGGGVGVKSMVDSGSEAHKRLLVILDTTGRMLSFSFTVHEHAKATSPVLDFCATAQGLSASNAEKLMNSAEDEEFVVDEQERFYIDKHVFESFHSDSITGMDTCPMDTLVATCSTDGTVRCLDYAKRTVVAYRRFNTQATCLKWLPRNLDATGKMIAVGFSDGVVRVLAMGQDDSQYSAKKGPLSLLRKMVFKPHNAPVTDISFSEDGSMLATAGSDGIVFFLQCNPVVDATTAWNPIRFVTMVPDLSGGRNKSPVSCKSLSWSPDNRNILCTCTDGVLREVDLSTMKELIMEAALGQELVTFEADFRISDIITKIPMPVAPMGKSASTATLAATTPGKPETTDSPSSPVKGESQQQLQPSTSVGALSGSETRPGTADTQATAVTAQISATSGFSQIPAKINASIYSIKRSVPGILTSASLNQRNYTFEGVQDEELPLCEIPNGLYTADGKDQLKSPQTSCFRYSKSKNFLVSGLSDGSVVLRPSEYLEVFARSSAHSGVKLGTAFIATSYDDRYLLSAGSDGTLVIRRVRLDLIESRARALYQDIDAGVFAGVLIKAPPISTQPEPAYLTFISTLVESNERSLFEIGRSAADAVASVLEAVTLETDEKDLAPGTYSIQDNRLKLEEDARKVAAEELKTRVRASIMALRKDYDNIIRENDGIPEVARLTPDELLVDREYLDILAEAGAEMIEEVHRECAYETEKSEKLLEKLSKRMMDGLLMDEITLAAFYPPTGMRVPKSVVCSFRAKSMDPSISGILEEVHKMVRVTELRDAQVRTNETAQRKANEAMDQLKNRLHHKDDDPDGDGAAALAQIEQKDSHTKTSDSAANHLAAESSVAARRIKRIERKEGMKKHLTEKPNEDEDDIRDLNAIRLAEKTIGDYKLKCADDYEVPEEQRNNATKKLRQMAMLEESMLSMRLQFNERFLALRNLKREMIFAIRRDNKRIREIDETLEQPQMSESLWEPRFDPDEFPDDADEVSEQELLQFETDRNSLPWEKVRPPKHVIVTGSKVEVVKNNKTGTYEAILRPRSSQFSEGSALENILSDARVMDETPERTEPPRFYEVNPSILTAYVRDPLSAQAQRLYQLENKVPSLRRIQSALKTRMHLATKSEAQLKAVAEMRSRLEFERSMIFSKMNENIAAFGEAVDDLRTDRHAITADLQLAELKLLVLFQEYQLLLTFEGRDAALQQKQVKCKTEESEIRAQANENKAKLEAKEEEMLHWVEKLGLISAEFKQMLPDSHPYCETLTKIFRKKIKRNKGRDDGEEEEEFDSDNEDEDDDDEDEEEVEDVCPPGCDQTLFEKIIDLREKKLDTEEVSAEIQKGSEDLKKTIDRLKSREKQIVKDGQQTELEVQQFQLQKQAALNQISVVVPLKLSQIYMFNCSGCMTGPTDKPVDEDNLELMQNIERLRDPSQRSLVQDVSLKTHTLFSGRNLVRLKERIDELHVEIDAAKEDFKHLHRERGQLTKERDSQKQEIEIWSARCRELQMLKFGREIDLDELEANSDRSKEKEAEGQLVDDAEKFKSKSMKLFSVSAKLQEQLAEVTRKNTKLLNEVAELTESQQKISKELNAPGQVVTHTSKLDNFREVEEQKRIAAYIKFQATELESLRTELNMLKRKEAPPVVMPSPPAPGRTPGDLVLPPIPGAKKIQS